MSLAARAILALIAGLGVGIAVSLSESASWHSLVIAIEPVGKLWVNALRMTVIPLVVALVITGIASAADVRVAGRLGARALLLFLGILGAITAFTVAVAPPLFARLQIDPAATAALRASASAPERGSELPTLGGWLTGFIPTNPVQAAAAGELLPLVVFSVLFAFALTRLAPELRQAAVRFFEAVREAMLVLVGWIIALAPVGVFALALALGTELGLSAAGALLYYIAVISVLLLVAILALYPLAVLGGGVPLGRFARAVLPAQAVAFGTRSSLASLPAMIEGAERRLRLPPATTGFVLPLAASIFKPASPIGWIVGALFVARLYGIELGAAELTTVALVSAALSFSHPGIPSGSPALKVPLYLAVGLPVEGVGILLAVDAIPDFFKTALNVTGPMAVATVLGRGSAEGVPVGAIFPEPGTDVLPGAGALTGEPPSRFV